MVPILLQISSEYLNLFVTCSSGFPTTSCCVSYSTSSDQFRIFKLSITCSSEFPLTSRCGSYSTPSDQFRAFKLICYFFRISYDIMLWFLFYTFKLAPNILILPLHVLTDFLWRHAVISILLLQVSPETFLAYLFHVLQDLLWCHAVLFALHLQISPVCLNLYILSSSGSPVTSYYKYSTSSELSWMLNLSVPRSSDILWRHAVFSILHLQISPRCLFIRSMFFENSCNVMLCFYFTSSDQYWMSQLYVPCSLGPSVHHSTFSTLHLQSVLTVNLLFRCLIDSLQCPGSFSTLQLQSVLTWEIIYSLVLYILLRRVGSFSTLHL